MMIYENVHVLDFSSLYPNLIRQMRLSPENEYSVNFNQDTNINLVIDKKEFNKENGNVENLFNKTKNVNKIFSFCFLFIFSIFEILFISFFPL